jgi:hypothetical protein
MRIGRGRRDAGRGLGVRRSTRNSTAWTPLGWRERAGFTVGMARGRTTARARRGCTGRVKLEVARGCCSGHPRTAAVDGACTTHAISILVAASLHCSDGRSIPDPVGGVGLRERRGAGLARRGGERRPVGFYHMRGGLARPKAQCPRGEGMWVRSQCAETLSRVCCAVRANPRTTPLMANPND